MDGGKRKSGGTLLSFFGAPTKRSKSSGGDDAAADAGTGEPGAGASAPAVAEAGSGVLAAPAEAPAADAQLGSGAGSALTVRTACCTAKRSRVRSLWLYRSRLSTLRQAAERRRVGINKALALARRAHASAAAVVAAAAAEARPPALADLIVEPSWREALAADLARDSFRSLETVRLAGLLRCLRYVRGADSTRLVPPVSAL
jgi:hypothetical protein